MDLLSKAIQINPNDQEAIQIKNQISNALTQENIIQMIQNAEGQVSGAGSATGTSKPPPPAAAKLPPLEGQAVKDPTPPLGTASGTTPPPPSNPSPGTSAGGDTTLQPLPPAPSPK